MELFYFGGSVSAIFQTVDCDQELREGVVQYAVNGGSTDSAQDLCCRSREVLAWLCDSRRAQSGFKVCMYPKPFLGHVCVHSGGCI